MRRTWLLLPGLLTGLVLAILLAGLGRAVAEDQPAQCQAPADLIDDDPLLPATAARLKAKQPLRIVAIGGASTAGAAAGNGQANAYPHRLEEALKRRHPGVAITVLNLGVAHQTTADMVGRFAREVVPADPTLVIWETGTVDAVRGIDVDAFTAALEQGIAALRQHHLDILLVNMQYNSSAGSVINFEPYLEAFRNTAEIADVYLFRRYEIMRFWGDAGVFNFVDAPKHRVRLAQEVYRCIGETLAEAIDYGAR